MSSFVSFGCFFFRELGRQRSTIELDTPCVKPAQLQALEEVVNEKIRAHVPVTVQLLSIDDPGVEKVRMFLLFCTQRPKGQDLWFCFNTAVMTTTILHQNVVWWVWTRWGVAGCQRTMLGRFGSSISRASMPTCAVGRTCLTSVTYRWNVTHRLIHTHRLDGVMFATMLIVSFCSFIDLFTPYVSLCLSYKGYQATGNWEREEKQNQPDLPGRKPSPEVRWEKLQHRALTGVSPEVRSKCKG